jgi:hypothetical protein
MIVTLRPFNEAECQPLNFINIMLLSNGYQIWQRLVTGLTIGSPVLH